MAGVLCRHAAVAVAFVLLAGVMSGSAAAQHVFTVGGEERGWREPAAREETYNHWATRNRFHLGDYLYFRYDKNDSVLLVGRDDYKLCSAQEPAMRFDGGETRFLLDRRGLFYFISGEPGHCDAGQRMTVRVMAQHAGGPSDAPAMSPGAGDDEGGSFSPPGTGSGSTPGSGAGSGSVPTPRPRGKTSGAASLDGGGGGYRVPVVVLAGAAAMLVLA